MSDDEYVFEEEDEGEEWVFDELDSDDDSTSSSYSSGSGSYISGVSGGKKSITKFSSSLSREDLNLTAPSKNLSISADKDLVDLPPVKPTTPVDSPKVEEKKKEKRSLFGKKKSKDIKRAASEPASKLIPNTVEISSPAASPQRAESKNEDSSSSDESMKDLENQIAALRIIESNGKDTKLLSLRPKRAQTTPNLQPGSSPFCAAVSSDPRVNIVSEIVTTEQTYVNDLEILIRNYLDPFRFRKAKKSNKPILTQQQIGILFSNIESILNLNQVLLNSLLAQMSLPSEQQRIGAAFSLLVF